MRVQEEFESNGELSPEVVELQGALDEMMRASARAFINAKNIAVAHPDNEGRPTTMVARYRVDGIVYMPVMKRLPNSGSRLVPVGGGTLVLHELPQATAGKAFICESFMELPEQYMVDYGVLWTDESGSLINKLSPDALVRSEHSLASGVIGMTKPEYDDAVDAIRKNQVAAALHAAPEIRERILGISAAERMRQIAQVLRGLNADDEIPGNTLDVGGLYNC